MDYQCSNSGCHCFFILQLTAGNVWSSTTFGEAILKLKPVEAFYSSILSRGVERGRLGSRVALRREAFRARS
jgi:hypothetical protein